MIMFNKQPRARTLTLETTPGAIADGRDASTLTITLTDGNTHVSGETVILSASSTTARFTSTNSPIAVVVTGDHGTASAQLTNTVPGTVHLSAMTMAQAFTDVTFGATAQLPAPAITEAEDGVINPSPAGDTVYARIGYPGITNGDELMLYWQGTPAGGEPNEEARMATHVVSLGEAAGGEVLVPVSVADYVAPYAGGRVAVRYTLYRGTGSVADSVVADYAVGEQARKGTLKVMGARSQIRGTNVGPINPERRLVALDAESLAPVNAEWQYEGRVESVTGSAFTDSCPGLPLHIRTADNHVTLNPSNINGNQHAMVARGNAGNLVAWGNSMSGGEVPAVIASLTDILETAGSGSSFAARRSNGTVVSWGANPIPSTIATLTDIVALSGSTGAFAALRANGSVVAWGDDNYGGVVPPIVANLTDIVQIIGNGYAFAALRTNGSVVAWGNSDFGGTVPTTIAGLTDISNVIASDAAFTARRTNGTVVAWGAAIAGGNVPSVIATLNDIAEVTGGTSAFVARRTNGQVVAWGATTAGGVIPVNVAGMDDIVSVTAGLGTFAALRENGSVVAWGNQAYGGKLPINIATLDDIVQVSGMGMYVYNNYRGAFAALRADGTVVAWGGTTGGTIPDSVQAQLTDVRAIYSSCSAFAALTSDDRVVTWGVADDGGDSSAVQALLTDHMSYEAASFFRIKKLIHA